MSPRLSTRPPRNEDGEDDAHNGGDDDGGGDDGVEDVDIGKDDDRVVDCGK